MAEILGECLAFMSFKDFYFLSPTSNPILKTPSVEKLLPGLVKNLSNQMAEKDGKLKKGMPCVSKGVYVTETM